jgi:DNA-binding transcriptional LysR family regulator
VDRPARAVHPDPPARERARRHAELFRRHTRGVDLTGAGELFLERARAALTAAEHARATGDDLQAGRVGSIRLGLTSAAGWSRAPELLAAFAAARPDVELSVVEAAGGALLRDLRDGRLDAILAPAILGSAELHRLHLGPAPWLVLAGAGHRLAAGHGPVAVDELEAEAILVTGQRDSAAYDRVVAETLSALGVRPELRRGGTGPALFAAVAGGEALALTTSPGVASWGMVARPLDPGRSIDFALLWREPAPAPALSRFIDTAAALAEPARPVLRAVA